MGDLFRGGKADIAARLATILVEELRYPLGAERIREDTPLYGRGLGLDSLDVVSLVARVEEEFAIFFEADELGAKLKTFGSLLDTVRRKVGDSRHGESC
jgi:acyl carrier protein